MSISESTFYSITIFLDKTSPHGWEELEFIAFDNFDCDGMTDFVLGEAQVDEILGKDAFCGGDLPEDLAQKLEDEVSGQNGKTFVFYEGDAETRALAFEEYLKAHNFNYRMNSEQTQDWDVEWRKHYAPIEVTDSLRVVPSWMKEDTRESKLEIYIDPGRGFGTGEHETTFLCLKHLSELKEQGHNFSSCLDFGCGSGILGIGHLLYEGDNCDFVDIDAHALDNCLKNINLNLEGRNLEGSALLLRDRFDANKKYDLVFANILEHVLISEKSVILNSLKEDSYLIVSGLLKEQEDNILKHYNSLTHIKTHAKGDWLAILFKK